MRAAWPTWSSSWLRSATGATPPRRSWRACRLGLAGTCSPRRCSVLLHSTACLAPRCACNQPGVSTATRLKFCCSTTLPPQDKVQQLEGELAAAREAAAGAQRDRDAALAAESAALQRQEAAAQAQAEAEQLCLEHAEERERAEAEAAKARVDAQRWALRGGCSQLGVS